MVQPGFHGLKFHVYTATDADDDLAARLTKYASIYAIATTNAGADIEIKDAAGGNILLKLSGANGLLVLPEPLSVGALVANVTISAGTATVFYITKA